jgi:uncharacterized protein involved in exopolysaccharide biosynthesis
VSDDKKQTPEHPEKPEIRYVPIEYMPHAHDDDDEIDLMALAKRIWDGRWTIVKITGLFILLGLFWALFSPEEFESEAILMPEIQTQQQGGAGRLLQQFGGAFGLGGLNAGEMPQGMIPPMIYPRIVNSLSFQLELLNHEVHFRDYGITTTWPDFLENHYSTPLTSHAVNYTVGLPFTILRGIRSLGGKEKEVIIQEDPLDAPLYITITKEQQELVEELRERISVSQDQETGLLTTRVKLQDARASAEMNRFLIERLREYVTDYRIEKARQNLEFSEQQKEEAQVRFEQSQLALADFMDRNVTVTTARAQTELERLQDEKNLAFNVYNSLAQRVEEARLNLQEQTPIFKEVQAVNVPSERSEPKRGRMIVIFTLLGGIFAVGIVLISPFITNFKSNFN